MPQGDKDKNNEFSIQKVARSQICNGTISQNKCYKKYILCHVEIS